MDVFLQIREGAHKANRTKPLSPRVVEDLVGKVGALRDALPADLRETVTLSL